VNAGYRHFFVDANAALHADYRYFDDDWGIESHTVEVAWHQNISDHTRVIPFVRYYTQDQADFFANQANVEDTYYADDFRLSAFGSLSGGLRLKHDIGNWSVNLTGERYESSESWGLSSGEESPALVDYWRYSIGLDYTFK
jgi:hypothetical protein